MNEYLEENFSINFLTCKIGDILMLGNKYLEGERPFVICNNFLACNSEIL